MHALSMPYALRCQRRLFKCQLQRRFYVPRPLQLLQWERLANLFCPLGIEFECECEIAS